MRTRVGSDPLSHDPRSRYDSGNGDRFQTPRRLKPRRRTLVADPQTPVGSSRVLFVGDAQPPRDPIGKLAQESTHCSYLVRVTARIGWLAEVHLLPQQGDVRSRWRERPAARKEDLAGGVIRKTEDIEHDPTRSGRPAR